MDTKRLLFTLTLLAQVLLNGSLVLQIRRPQLRIWPPPGKRSFGFIFTWGLFVFALFGVLTLGVLDWNTFIFRHPARFWVAVPLMLGGLGLALWGVRTLSVHTALGLEGELVTHGPYRFTRNPQYVGDILLVLGYGLFTNSALALVAGAFMSVWFFLASFVEEPYLRARFGPAYEAYARQVPRFVGWRSVKALWQAFRKI